MRKYLLGLAIIGMIGIVSAFPASINVLDRTATADDPAEFKVEVENDFVNQRSFRVSSISSPPPTGSWFSYGNSQTIEAGNSTTFSIMVSPPKTAIQQNYRFNVNVRTLEGENHEKLSSYFSVKSQNDIKIMSTEISSQSYKPGNQLFSNITVFNSASSPLNYEVEASAFNKTSSKSSAIASGSSREHGFSLKIPEETVPGEYESNLSIIREGQKKDSVIQSFEVKPIKNTEFSTIKDDRIFEYSESIKATNNGNSEARIELNKTLPGYITPLTSFNTTPDRIEDVTGGSTYYWSFDVPPGEKAAVSYKTRYWPPLVILSLLFTGLILLKRLYEGVVFSKHVRRTDEGIKVHLELENRSNHEIDKLKVKDFVPDIASVDEEFPMAKPVIRKTNNGTRLVWEIESMNPGEQRVFEYTIKPLVEVEGGVTLPKAKLEIEEQRISETEEKTVEFRPE